MKTLSAAATAIVAIVLLCALSTGGQQGTEKGSVPRKNQPGFIPATHRIAYLPDGRIVAFPISTSEEEIDAVAKHITEGAVELPPRTKVIGWQPVEDATSLLPRYAERVATVPTVKGKLDALANAAGILQTQIDLMKNDIKYAHARIAIEEKSSDGLAKVIDGNAAVLGDYAGRLTTTTNQLDDLKRELDKFKDAACPVLRRATKGPRRSWDDVAGAMADQSVQMRLDTVCGLH